MNLKSKTFIRKLFLKYQKYCNDSLISEKKSNFFQTMYRDTKPLSANTSTNYLANKKYKKIKLIWNISIKQRKNITHEKYFRIKKLDTFEVFFLKP